jgi:DNA-binding SARP family transcriptional activator
MEFCVLGSLEVRDEGRLVDLGGARQRALLSILLLHRNTVVPAERLIDQLYGAHPPPTAGKSLQVHVSRLRKALGGDGRLVTRQGGYGLELSGDEVDVDRFAALVEAGRRALMAGEPERSAVALEEALELVRGPAFQDVAYEDFAQAEIAKLGELQLAARELLLETRVARGRHAEAIPELEQLVASHPLRERPRAQLMLALYRDGRQADALAIYQDGRRLLVEELGIEPSRPLLELERSILNQDSALDLGTGADAPIVASPGGGRLAAGIFVGRERELAQLGAALLDARFGQGRLVLLSGEAGIGKSRLADELAAQASSQGADVFWGRCWEAGGAPAFWPWVQVLRGCVSNANPETLRWQLGRSAADVAHLLPDLRERFPDLPEAPALDSDGARFRLFESTAAFLRRMAAERPLVLVLDDLHAADTSSLLLLEFVVSEIVDARVLILAIYRDPELEPGDPTAAALADVARRASLRLSLGGLAGTEVASYVALSAPVQAPASLVAAITTETEGNPLFISEIVRMLASEGRLDQTADVSWQHAIPETVKEVIGRRLHRLSDDCRTTLALASVLGREFEPDIVGRLADRPSTELLALFDEANSQRVVASVPGQPGRVRFTHALIRETLYDALPPGRRVDYHLRAAHAIEALAATDLSPHLSSLAHHYFRAIPAANPDTVLSYAVQAAEQASRLLAHEEAARLYDTALRALALRPVTDSTPEQVILLGLGDALTRSGDTVRARDAFLRAAGLARASGSSESLGKAALGYSGRIVWARAGANRLVVPLLEEALAAVGDEPTALRARLLARLAGALRDERDPTRRVETAELAVSTARSTNDKAALTYALAGLCGARHGIGDPEERLEITRELRETAHEIGDQEPEFEACIAEILIYLERGSMSEVRERIATVSALGDELRQPSHRWFAFMNHALLALHEGRYADAEAQCEQGHEIGKRAEPDLAESTYALQLYEIRRQQGRSAEIYDLVASVARDNHARPVFRCAQARLALELGRSSEARQLFEELASGDFDIIPRDNEWLLAAGYLADVCRSLGDTVRAAVLYDQLAPSAHKIVSDLAEGCAGSVERILGNLAAMLGRDALAIGHLRNAIAINRSIGTTPWLAEAQLDLAELLLASYEKHEARELLETASATAAELGMTPLLDRAAALGNEPSWRA